MSQRANQKAESFESISDAASKLVRRRGLEATTVQKVMSDAGLTVGAFYAHFGDKDEMIETALNRAMAEVSVLIEEASRGKSGTAALISVAKKYLSLEHRDDPCAGCPLPSALGMGATDTTSRIHRKMLAEAVETMAKRLSASSRGEVSDKSVLASLATMVGAQVIARATKGSGISESVLNDCTDFLERTLQKKGKHE